MITFRVDTRELDDKLHKLSLVDKERIHEGMGYLIENSVVRQVDAMGLVDTGRFRNSIHHTSSIDNTIICDGVNYGIHLEYGTRPHIIKARNKKVLADVKEGKIFGKTVHHPGTREYAPFRKGLIASQEEVTKYVRDKIIEYAK